MYRPKARRETEVFETTMDQRQRRRTGERDRTARVRKIDRAQRARQQPAFDFDQRADAVEQQVDDDVVARRLPRVARVPVVDDFIDEHALRRSARALEEWHAEG